MLKVFVSCLAVLFLFGCYMNQAAKTIKLENTCMGRCIRIVNTTTLSWPFLETAFRFLGIIPNTPLACERICLTKTIKNL